MNPIELTDLQKSKLAEMCKILFPEYYNIGFYSQQSSTLQISKEAKLSNDIIFIHWFEFCMTKLWIKINSLLNHKTPEELMSMYSAFWDISNKKLHPIDYLYKQFKQLKIK